MKGTGSKAGEKLEKEKYCYIFITRYYPSITFMLFKWFHCEFKEEQISGLDLSKILTLGNDEEVTKWSNYNINKIRVQISLHNH